jgi:1-acyl-sn-glycerol-3-phosphate acyltransferase
MAAEPQLVSTSVSDASERQDAYYWRLLWTAVGFVWFGVGALLIGGVALPIVRILPGSRTRKRIRARRIIGYGMHSFVTVCGWLGVWTYEFRGLERLGRPGQLVLANHPSLVDAVFLLSVMPAANCIMKEALWRNPLTRWAVALAEYITNESATSMIEGAVKALREGETLVMFPEGTRTKPQERCIFHRGAANIALRAARVVTPVYIRCEPTTLTKGQPWYRIPSRRIRMTLIVGEDLDLEPHRRGPLPVASRTFNDYLQTHFDTELARHAGERCLVEDAR